MSTPNKVLQALAGTNQYVALAISLGETLIPLGKGLVTEIKQIATGGETVTYAVLLQMDAAELDAIEKLSVDDIAAINVELAKLKLPPVPVLGSGDTAT